ncbi:UNVERIFIED_CONTAM: hypothetical protein Sindi_2489500, partial [Sesamum indicum]
FHKSGYLRETRFQLHGTLEWYKSLNDKKKQIGGNYNFTGNLKAAETSTCNVSIVKTDLRMEVADLLAELLKLVKNKETPSNPISNFANYVHTEEKFTRNSESA